MKTITLGWTKLQFVGGLVFIPLWLATVIYFGMRRVYYLTQTEPQESFFELWVFGLIVTVIWYVLEYVYAVYVARKEKEGVNGDY